MRVNLNNIATNYKGHPIKDRDNHEMTWKDVIIELVNIINDKSTAEDKRMGYVISNDLYKTNRPTLSSKQKVFIISQAEKFATPVILGKLEAILEGQEVDTTVVREEEEAVIVG